MRHRGPAAEAAAQTLAAQQEIDEISGEFHNFQKITVERDGKLVEIEVPIDDIDLLEDFDDEDEEDEDDGDNGILILDWSVLTSDEINERLDWTTRTNYGTIY